LPSAVRAVASLAVLVACGRVASAQESIPVKAGVTVSPDTVRIGDAFRVTVGLRAPLGATIEFPAGPDSSSTVQSLDPVVVRTTPDTTAVEQYADYRVAAWDVDSQPVKLADAIVRLNGVVRRVPLTVNAVFVKSVLPADTAQRVPKPPRDLFTFSVFPWWIVALVAAAIVVGLLVWWLWRRRRRRVVEAPVDPYVRAQAEFQRIEALGLLEAGERGRYVALTVEVLRDYLAARYAEASLSLTSTELQRSVRELPFVPHERLMRTLTDADLVKFARRPVSSARARELGSDMRAIVEQEHFDSQPAPTEHATENAAA
jgi:hypothetical protein